MNIQMVDLRGQYLRIKDEVDRALADVLDSAYFIRGPIVSRFEHCTGRLHRIKACYWSCERYGRTSNLLYGAWNWPRR